MAVARFATGEAVQAPAVPEPRPAPAGPSRGRRITGLCRSPRDMKRVPAAAPSASTDVQTIDPAGRI